TALLAPSGYSIGSSKDIAGFTYTAEVCPAVAGRTKGLYHPGGAVARVSRRRRRADGRSAGGVYNGGKATGFSRRGKRGNRAEVRRTRRTEGGAAVWMITIGFGAALTVQGVVGYLLAEAQSQFGLTGTKGLTALIPSLFGVVLIVCGVLARRENLRKHAMH